MFRPTQACQKTIRRLRLTTKQARGGYYKGNRTGSMGQHTSKGKYVIDWDKVRTYAVPDLEDFKLTPFVSKAIKEGDDEYRAPRIMTAKGYRAAWEEQVQAARQLYGIRGSMGTREQKQIEEDERIGRQTQRERKILVERENEIRRIEDSEKIPEQQEVIKTERQEHQKDGR